MAAPSVRAAEPAFPRTGYGSYGVISRLQTAPKRVITRTLDGAFNAGFEVGFYDLRGRLICKGKIQSVFRDMTYISAEECDRFERLVPGMGVAFNGDNSDLMSVYRNRGKIEAAMADREWNRYPGVPWDIDEEQYENMVLKSSVPLLVEFYAKSSPPCEATAPVVVEIATDLEGRVRVATLDKDRNPRLWAEMKSKGFPAFFIVRDGKVLAKWAGPIDDKPFVLRHIKRVLDLK